MVVPPSPLALIHGLLLAINRAEQRLHGGTWAASPAGAQTLEPLAHA